MSFEPEAIRTFEHAGWQRAAASYGSSFAPATAPYIEPLLEAAEISSGQHFARRGVRARPSRRCCVRSHTPFYEESDATRAARLFRLAYGRRLRCLLKAHSGVGPDAPEHDLVPVMAWRGFVPAHGSRDARYATIARRSCSSRLATTWAINGLHSPVRAPCWKS